MRILNDSFLHLAVGEEMKTREAQSLLNMTQIILIHLICLQVLVTIKNNTLVLLRN